MKPGDRRSADENLLALVEDQASKDFFRALDELLLRRFVEQERGTALQLGCYTTDLTDGLMAKIKGTGKLVVVDPRVPLLDAVRFHMGSRHPGRLFFKSDHTWEKLPFDGDVFNAVISNLFWDSGPSREGLLSELYRVLLPGASLLLTVFLEDSFHEFYDLYSETTAKFDLLHLGSAIQAVQGSHPGEEKMLSLLETSGFSLCRATAVDRVIEYKSSKEFVGSPLVKALWLPVWSTIGGDETDRIFWHIREAMDRYFGDRPFRLTTRIGVLSGIK